MPSTYAHYRFGKEVYHRLPKAQREMVRDHKSLYMAGLHGPDILFYYHALWPNWVNRRGFAMHGEKASELLGRTLGICSREERAYLFGFICHYALDSSCHSYIDEKIRNSGISHTEIEVEFDRMLMVSDGYDPLRHQLTGHILADIHNCRVISHVLGILGGRNVRQINPKRVQRSLREMKFYNRMLIAPHIPKRLWIYALLFVTGNYKEMHGLIVNRKENARCADSSRELLRRYRKAVPLAVELIRNYDGVSKGECGILDARFNHSFGVE